MPACRDSDDLIPAEGEPLRRGGPAFNKGTADFPAEQTNQTGQRCLNARPVIQVKQNQPAELTLQLRDRNGVAYVIPDSATFIYKFYASSTRGDSTPEIEATGLGTDVAAGTVDFILTAQNTAKPGIYVATLVALDGDDVQVATDYWLEIAPVVGYRSNGPLTLAELRLELRDLCPEMNELLGDFEYSDDELAHCIFRPIDEFNCAYQPVTRYTPNTFPREYRYAWLEAAAGYALRMAATLYAREQLAYSAGGLSIDDKNKLREYTQMSRDRLAEWKSFTIHTKTKINNARGWGSLGSGY